MTRCEVCGATDRGCGHQPLRLPVVDLAPIFGGPMPKRQPPVLVRPAVAPHHGRAGWRNAIVVDPGLEGIPLAEDPELEGIPLAADPEFAIADPERELPRSSVLVDGRPLDEPGEVVATEGKPRPRRKRG